MIASLISIAAAALLCGMVAGFLFAFSLITMPAIGRLDDRQFVRNFQLMDGIIQNNHPLFMLVWVGSIIATLAATALSWTQLQGTPFWLAIAAAATYLGTVQVPTLAINIPLNNQLQGIDVDTADDEQLKTARQQFEPQWNRWNRIRTVTATVVTILWLSALVLS